MHQFAQSLTVTGYVVDIIGPCFRIQCLSGDEFDAYVGVTTNFDVLRNLDNLSNDRVTRPTEASPADLLSCYVSEGQLVIALGIWQISDAGSRFDVRSVVALASVKDRYVFEETHWWLTQTARLADQWLDSLFGERRSYELDDFVKLYRTSLNILGLPTEDETQECAVLSRLIYGLSSAYLLSGQERYRRAAEAGVKFQRDAFRSLSHDGKFCFWAFGRRRTRYGTQLMVPSSASFDMGSIALYEQIYALAGLAQYYRISLDPEVLDDISRTMATFDSFFLDTFRDDDPAFQGYDGWFSHIDYSTLRPDRNTDPANNNKKNWNSIGDHIPAYLVNLILALDPLPRDAGPEAADLLEQARGMLERATRLILQRFFDRQDSSTPYVNERFFADWEPDHGYAWQQNRAIIGHNFKISWNLIRVANYFESVAAARSTEAGEAARWRELAEACVSQADGLAHKMTQFGIDQIRGGCFDAVERDPQNGGQPVEFTWMNTKDFWQQEQAILAYLILYGATRNEYHLKMARHTAAFWNAFFLDRDNRGVYFRLTENGQPILDSSFSVRGGHSDASGYHCFELAYLAHVYTRAYVAEANRTDQVITLYFRPDANCGVRSLNVLPDFMAPGRVRVQRVTVGGASRPVKDPYCYQVPLLDGDLGRPVAVELCAEGR